MGLQGLDWATVILTITIIGVIGPGIDLLMLYRHKNKLQEYCLNAWNKLDDASIPDLGRLLARRVSSLLEILIGNWSFLNIAKSAFLIIIINSIVLYISYILFFEKNTFGETRQFFILFTIFWPILLINVPFDYLSISVTRWTLRKVSSGKIISATFHCFFDLVIAAVLATLCASAYVFLEQGPVILEHPLEGANRIHRVIGVASGIVPFEMRADDWEYSIGILALTTFFPTLFFILVIAMAITVKSVVEIIQWIFMYIFEKFTENDAGSIGIFAKLSALAVLVILVTKMISSIVGVWIKQ